VIRHLALLTAGSLFFGLVTALPAARLWGSAMIVDAAVAGALCLVPTALAQLLAGLLLRPSPHERLLRVLGGMGLRMTVVLGVGSALYLSVPYFSEQDAFAFWGWILAYYAFTLALEVFLVVRDPVPGRVGTSLSKPPS
jgi:hypothetical protein